MKIKKLRIINYKLFNDVIIEMNDDVNIFVGENDSGKTTILEALTMVLTGRVNGGSLLSRFNLDWFNLEARNKFKTAGTPEEEMAASGELNKALGRLMMLTEAYPDLKANENFIQLQTDLKDVEEKIAFARQFYNDTVLSYMNKFEMFPSNIVAKMFNFKEAKYFEAEEEAKTAPKVSF